MARPKSSTLFHFTKSPESLMGILKHGFIPRFSVEDFSWLDPSIGRMALPMVCFCDIPLGRTSEHIAFYGSYGLGMSKEWGTKNGLNALSYVSPASTYARHFSDIWESLLVTEAKTDPKRFESLASIVAFQKPLSGEVVVAGNPVEKDFYQESEWRYVPEPEDMGDKFLMEDEFSDKKKLTEMNDKIGTSHRLSFNPEDIRYIFVKCDADIPKLVNFVSTEMDHFSSSSLKILMTRITSIESIDGDL